MKLFFAVSILVASAVTGCATNSKEEQHKAEMHQTKSDEAAAQGHYGIAGEEQRKAADSHHEAVKKAIDEGQPIPPQTERGGRPDAGR